MRYRFVILLITLLTSMAVISCGQSGNGQQATNRHQPMADSIYTIDAARPSFRQPIKIADKASEKKFVRITVDSIRNPAAVAISFEVYWHAEGKSQLLGMVSPFPADNPGSFVVATGGKLTGNGELELRLKFPEGWNKKDTLEVKMSRLRIE